MPPVAALRISRERRGSAVHQLKRMGLIDHRFRIAEEGEWVMIPLTGVPDALPPGGELVDTAQFRKRSAGMPISSIRKAAALTDMEKSLLPCKWEMIGKALLLKLDESLTGREGEIGRAYASVLGADSVYRVTGRIGGRNRRPSVRLIYGNGGETVHHENGVDYVIDPAKIMFSSANHDERIRMASLDCNGELVADMFAGIGHLSMPIAVHSSPRLIAAAEIDPLTHAYLLKTVHANGADSFFQAHNLDSMDLRLEGCDRIIMGYLDGTRRWLGKALTMSRPGTIIHFHEEVRRGASDEWRRLISEKYCSGRVKVIAVRRVKGFSALSDHMAMDMEVLE